MPTHQARQAGRRSTVVPVTVSKLADISRNKIAQNTLAIGAALSMTGIGFQALESVLIEQFRKKEKAVIDENVGLARVGYDSPRKSSRPSRIRCL